MIPGFLIAVLTAIATAFYIWQTRMPRRTNAFLAQAKAAQKQGDLAAAEVACLQAVVCARMTYLRRGDALVLSLYNLASVYFQRKKLELAEQSAAKALAAARRLHTPSAAIMPLLGLFGQIEKKLGKDLTAGPLLQVSIELLRRKYGNQSPQVGASLHELGVILTRLGVSERAVEVLTESIPILERRLGKSHGDVAAALTNLGKAQTQLERYADAEKSYRRALAIREAAGGPDHPEVALILNNLAVNYKRQDRIPEALECLHRALAIREAKLGPEHPNVGLVLNNLANCLRLERHYSEAEAALARAMSIFSKTPHPSFPTVLDSFASLRAAQGRYEEAGEFYAQCLKIYESQPSSNLKELTEACERYAGVLYKLQKEKEADALLAKVEKLHEAREKLNAAVPVAG